MSGRGGRACGAIDPFCLLAVLPAVFVAVIAGLLGGIPSALAVVTFAGLILLFDSWANRSDPSPRRPVRRHPARPAPRPAPARTRSTSPAARQRRRPSPGSSYR